MVGAERSPAAIGALRSDDRLSFRPCGRRDPAHGRDVLRIRLGRPRVEIISLLTISAIALGLYLFPLPGQKPTDGLKLAFGGFGHYALITICALMVMGRGLVTTGALEPAARVLTRVWRVNRQLGLLTTLLLAMAMSMMVNDTPVLVLLLPIMAAIAVERRHARLEDADPDQQRGADRRHGDDHRHLDQPARRLDRQRPWPAADERVPLHADRADGGAGGAALHLAGDAAAAAGQLAARRSASRGASTRRCAWAEGRRSSISPFQRLREASRRPRDQREPGRAPHSRRPARRQRHASGAGGGDARARRDGRARLADGPAAERLTAGPARIWPSSSWRSPRIPA